jgi:lipopolysaccharide export system permease protein
MKILFIYISKKFLGTFFFSLIALGIIFIIVDLFENLDEFLDRNSSMLNIMEFYIYYIPSILKLLIPIGTLLSTLFTIGNLSTLNEITAMKSGSLSLYKLMIPVIFLAISISIFQLWFSTLIVPKASKVKNELSEKYLGKDAHFQYLTNIFIRETPTRNVLIREFNAEFKTGSGFQIQDFSSELNPRVQKKYYANLYNWDKKTKKWLLKDVKLQTFDLTKMTEQSVGDKTFALSFNENELTNLVKPEEEMNIFEQYKFLQFQKKGGKDINQGLTDFHGILAFPFANLIVVLFGVPFASVKRRGGIAIQIGAALIVSFAYLVFTKIGQIIGISIGIGPVLSAWMANILFLISGIIVLIKTPK